MKTQIDVTDNLILKYFDGKLCAIIHPLDGTSVEIWEDNMFQFRGNELHRDNDLPAVIFKDGQSQWYKNNVLHRENGKPAITYSDRKCYEYWENGILIRKETE